MSSATLAILVLLTIGTIAGLIVYILKRPGEMPLPMREPAINDSRVSSQWAGGL
jgi:uncharacterized membrane protein YagU involved in acid resistance